MDLDLEHLAAAVLRLPTHHRADLAARLLASLHDGAEPGLTEAEWEAEWGAECDRREAELEADPSIGIPIDEVFRRVEASLGARVARRDQAA